MPYTFFLGDTMLPVTPGQLQLKIKNQNKTMTLISDGEINLLKKAGLSSFSFKALLPNTQYPFAQYKDGFRPAAFYLDALERLKTAQRPFQFIVSRTMPDGKILSDTNMTVSLEEYSVTEDASNGFDMQTDISLKQYAPYATKIISVDEPSGDPLSDDQIPQATVDAQRPSDPSIITRGTTVTVNGQLFRDSYGEGPGRTLTNFWGKVNFINERGSRPYHIADLSDAWLGWVAASDARGVGP